MAEELLLVGVYRSRSHLTAGKMVPSRGEARAGRGIERSKIEGLGITKQMPRS